MLTAGHFVDAKGNKLENSPEFKEMVTTLMWSLERTKSYANSKGAESNVAKADAAIEKYAPLKNEVARG